MRAGLRRRGALLGALVALVGVASACIPDYVGNPTGPRVGVLGDSITNLSTDEITAAFQVDTRVSVSSFPGLKLVDAFATAQEYADSAPDYQVIELGTNDVGAPDYDATLAWWKIADMTGRFASAQCVAWVNVDENSPAASYWHDHAVSFNANLAYWAANRPNVRIVDWNSVILYLGRGILEADGIHPNAFGQQILASIMHDAVVAGPC